ncbi:MAG: hypothetical protein HY466_05390 [Deltaproteobacteria bacterium]|nr:hypothetical protein [Deltaproteobacteria bacterium]
MEKNKQPLTPASEISKSPLDLWRLMGGKSRPVRGETRHPADSLLAVYKERLTYTFIFGREVASIHFDRAKREIFFKGRNIRNLQLSAAQKEVLEGFKRVLGADERAIPFLKAYEATLGSLLADNK